MSISHSSLKIKYPELFGAPAGYRVVRVVTPEITAKAIEVKNKINIVGYGYTEEFGKKYLARVEPHYDNHPKNGGDAYWHPGVTVYEKII